MRTKNKQYWLGIFLLLSATALIFTTFHILNRDSVSVIDEPRRLVTTGTTRLSIVNQYCKQSPSPVDQSERSTN